eukprot:6214450-Pleurochrysis_carterae.AAC.4
MKLRRYIKEKPRVPAVGLRTGGQSCRVRSTCHWPAHTEQSCRVRTELPRVSYWLRCSAGRSAPCRSATAGVYNSGAATDHDRSQMAYAS